MESRLIRKPDCRDVNLYCLLVERYGSGGRALTDASRLLGKPRPT